MLLLEGQRQDCASILKNLLPFHLTYFGPQLDSYVSNAVQSCFPHIRQEFRGVAEHALASLVYHWDYLKTRLDEHHLMWSCALVRTEGMLDELKRRVKCGLPGDPGIEMKSTGCPPHVMQNLQTTVQEVRRLKEEMSKMKKRLRKLDGNVGATKRRRQTRDMEGESELQGSDSGSGSGSGSG